MSADRLMVIGSTTPHAFRGSASEEQRTEEALLARRAEPAAFAELYHRHVDAIWKFVTRRVLDTDLAQDLTAEVFLVAWRKVRNFRPDRIPFRHWLYGIATRTVHADRRRRGRRTHLPLTEEPVSPGSAEIPDDVARLHEALQQLPRAWRETVTLHYFEELPLREIAAVLGVREGTVKSRLARARNDLARRLGGLR